MPSSKFTSVTDNSWSNYSGRQVDLELLQHVEKPVPYIRVTPGIADGTRIVSGIEKAVQRYAKLLLTNIESVRFHQWYGSNMLPMIANGAISTEPQMELVFAIASDRAVTAMMSDDNDFETFGTPPDDERIETAELDHIELDVANATIHIQVNLTMVSGDTYIYVTPVDMGISQ